MTSQLVLATGNQHKIQEMQQILQPLGISLVSANEAGGMPEVDEDTGTFQGNASKKALVCARFLNRTVIADDSGLEVAALNGEPGVYSARYACEGGNDGRNMTKLLDKMKHLTDRRARFVCVIAIASPHSILGTAEGQVPGTIAQAPQGNGGFGYDPVFIPDGFSRTFGELPQETKNQLSHRANALKAALPLLKSILVSADSNSC